MFAIKKKQGWHDKFHHIVKQIKRLRSDVLNDHCKKKKLNKLSTSGLHKGFIS